MSAVTATPTKHRCQVRVEYKHAEPTENGNRPETGNHARRTGGPITHFRGLEKQLPTSSHEKTRANATAHEY